MYGLGKAFGGVRCFFFKRIFWRKKEQPLQSCFHGCNFSTWPLGEKLEPKGLRDKSVERFFHPIYPWVDDEDLIIGIWTNMCIYIEYVCICLSISIYMYMCIDIIHKNACIFFEISEKKTFDHHFGPSTYPGPSPKDSLFFIRLYCPERKCGLSLAHPIWQLSRQRCFGRCSRLLG